MFAILRYRDYRLIAAGQLTSSLGDWLLLVAAPFFVLRLTGSTLATGATMAAEFVPAVLLGPIAGVFADRWDRRRTMLTADLARAAAVASMLLIHSPRQVWILYAALLVEAGFGQFFAPARQALVPAVVGRGPQLRAAKSFAALIGGVVRLVGGPAGGVLFALSGFQTVVAIDAGSYLVSALVISAVRYRADGRDQTRTRRCAIGDFIGELRDGWSHIRTAPALPRMFVAAAVFFAGNAMLTALLVPYVADVLHASSMTMGLLFSALGIGYLAGAPVSRAAGSRFTDRAVLTGCLIALAAVFTVSFNVRDQAWDLALFTLIGPPAVCFLVTADTLLAQQTPDAVLGRTSAAYNTVQSAATLAGMLIGASLGQQIGIGAALNAAAAVVGAAAFCALAIPACAPMPSCDEEEPASEPVATSTSGLWLPRDSTQRLVLVRHRLAVVRVEGLIHG
jgi:predicted MFS family arabinose efflux permease